LAFGIGSQEVITVENNQNITEASDPIPIEKNRTKQLKEILCLSKD
jgi:hypothetical protein